MRNVVIYGGELSHHGTVGMKWGVRRYQNPDGSLTEEGRLRYGGEVRANRLKKKKNRVDEDSLRDPERWAREDNERLKNVSTSTADLSRSTKTLVDKLWKPKETRLDLSNMTDKELRDYIDRKRLEQQYIEAYNKEHNVSKGKEFTMDALDILGAAAGVATSTVALAIAIQTLKQGLGARNG